MDLRRHQPDLSASQSESLLCPLGNGISTNTIKPPSPLLVILYTINRLPATIIIHFRISESILIEWASDVKFNTKRRFGNRRRIFSLVWLMRHRSEIIFTPPKILSSSSNNSISHPPSHTWADCLKLGAVQERRTADSEQISSDPRSGPTLFTPISYLLFPVRSICFASRFPVR